MKELRRLVVVVPAVALAVLVVLLFLNRGAMEQLAFLKRGATVSATGGPVDQRPTETAETLAGMAVSAEEQGFAQQAERLAAHEVDKAFEQALKREEIQPKRLTGEAAALAAKVAGLQASVKADQASVDTLTAAAKARADRRRRRWRRRGSLARWRDGCGPGWTRKAARRCWRRPRHRRRATRTRCSVSTMDWRSRRWERGWWGRRGWRC